MTAFGDGTYKDSDDQVSQSKRYQQFGIECVLVSKGSSLIYKTQADKGFPRFLGNGLRLAHVMEPDFGRY